MVSPPPRSKTITSIVGNISFNKGELQQIRLRRKMINKRKDMLRQAQAMFPKGNRIVRMEYLSQIQSDKGFKHLFNVSKKILGGRK
jgi:hypothetical protein